VVGVGVGLGVQGLRRQRVLLLGDKQGFPNGVIFDVLSPIWFLLPVSMHVGHLLDLSHIKRTNLLLHLRDLLPQYLLAWVVHSGDACAHGRSHEIQQFI